MIVQHRRRIYEGGEARGRGGEGVETLLTVSCVKNRTYRNCAMDFKANLRLRISHQTE